MFSSIMRRDIKSFALRKIANYFDKLRQTNRTVFVFRERYTLIKFRFRVA